MVDEGDEDDEPPTKPDMAKFSCPSCTNSNGIPTGHVGTRICEWCGGLCWVNRETLANWGASRTAKV